LGSDQTSLHNPYAGGYYPTDISFEDANAMMAENPILFKEKVQETLRRHTTAINKHTAKGTYFFDYGNAFLLEARRSGYNGRQSISNTELRTGYHGAHVF
jgi:urocanate hydratase